ncbi:histidine kinase [Paenibacillus beijingensis]|uniref:Histidine kinase n=1 Tax=Paenibacillus beijingensis TaxID=1126833 RepID=A0A0D5NQV2_9BACL|nr:histidine kinase [Paenibacillus beijingensis]
MPDDIRPEQLLGIVFDYTAQIASECRLGRVLSLLADMGCEMIAAERCKIWLIDKRSRELYTIGQSHFEQTRIPHGSGIVGYAVATGEIVVTDHAKAAPRRNAQNDRRTTCQPTKGMIIIPFSGADGQPLGAFQAINKRTPSGTFSKADASLLSLAASYAGKSLESVILQEEIAATQQEILYIMGQVGETGNHVRRVAEYSYLLALGLGLPKGDAERIKVISPMHDIGKAAIPDAVLNKPGKLTDEEYRIMQRHAEIGYKMLISSQRELMRTAALVAYQHHEKWDGTGYPQRLKGEDIHLYARITAVADVFDALGSDRVYKRAWEMDQILSLFHSERGKHFDPDVVDALMKQLQPVLEIRSLYQD